MLHVLKNTVCVYLCLLSLAVSSEINGPNIALVDTITLKNHHGEESLFNLFDIYQGRRLFDREDASYSFSLKARTLSATDVATADFSEISCGNLETMGKYKALSDDLEVVIHESTSLTKTKTGYSSNTLMSRDFSCVVSFSQLAGGIHMQGVHLHPELGHQEFKVIPCPAELGDTVSVNETCVSVETAPIEDLKCDIIELEEANSRMLSTVKAALPFTLEEWETCHSLMKETHEIQIGIAVGSEFVKRLGGSRRVLPFIEALVAESNVIYLQQLNVKMLVKKIVVVDTSAAGSTDWDNPGCKLDIFEQLRAFYKSDREELGLWKLIDDCYTSGAIGVAVKSSLCGRAATGVTYFAENGGTWKIFAHEVGHIFGASHSFENGAGKTGGIMDYADGVYNNEIQFNTKYRKEEVCNFLSRKQDCPYWRVLTDELVSSLSTCGNGKLDDGEECDCPGGKRDCDCCKNCKLKPNALCSPFSNECCTETCEFKPTSQICSHSDGPGYCRNGFCAASECVFMGRGDYCGIQNEELPCRKRCYRTEGDYCSVAPSLYYHGRNVRNIRDGAFCQTNEIEYGQCFNGDCFQVERSSQTKTSYPTKSPTEYPTPATTKFPTAFPTTKSPTAFPTVKTTSFPTKFPTKSPTPFPTAKATNFPTVFPTTTEPTAFPTKFPTTLEPTSFPTNFPSVLPTPFPTPKSNLPQTRPTKNPTPFPTRQVTPFPTTNAPSSFPTLSPTKFPVQEPTSFPTNKASAERTSYPTFYPTEFPASSFVPDMEDSKESMFCCNDLQLIYGENSFVLQNEQSPVCLGAVWAGNSCQKGSFSKASDLCSSIGARLCTAAEIQSETSDNLGCDFDNARVWTNTHCTTNQGSSGYLVVNRSGDKDDSRCRLPEKVNSVVCCAEVCTPQ